MHLNSASLFLRIVKLDACAVRALDGESLPGAVWRQFKSRDRGYKTDAAACEGLRCFIDFSDPESHCQDTVVGRMATRAVVKPLEVHEFYHLHTSELARCRIDYPRPVA